MYLKSRSDIEKMYKSGQVAKEVMTNVLAEVRPGVTTAFLNTLIEKNIKKLGARPSFFGIDGYKYSSCISINDEVVHGLPKKRVLYPGDIISIDLGANLNGWNSDMCRTVLVNGSKNGLEKKKEFLKVGEISLNKAIKKALVGNSISDISIAIQNSVEFKGFSVIRDLVGHGIGKKLHEDPLIPCYYDRTRSTFLKEGMVLAIEVMYSIGSGELYVDNDNWTFKTKDGALSAMFEDTVAITSNGPRVLTK